MGSIMFPPYKPGIRVNSFQRFTGSVDDLYNLIYSLENEIRVLEGTANKTDAQWRRLNSIKGEVQYLYIQQAKPENAYTVSFGECGVGYTNPNTISFPDYADSLIADTAGDKERAIATFKRNVKNLFERFLYSMSQGRLHASALDNDLTASKLVTNPTLYQYYWNWFQQGNDSMNPDPTKIVYVVTSMDTQYNIPSNPEAYSPKENGVLPEDIRNINDLEPSVNIADPTINPYVDPNKYVFTGSIPEDVDPAVEYHREHGGGIIPPHIAELYPDVVSPVIYLEDEQPDCETLYGTEGLFYDTTRGACRCPDGQHVDSATKKCVADTVTKTCETGYHLEGGVCVKDKSSQLDYSDNTINLLGMNIKTSVLIGAVAVLAFVIIIRKL